MLGVRRMTSRARSQSGRQHLCFGVSVSPDRGSIALATAHASQGGVKAVPSNTVAICGSCSFWSRGHAKSARLRCAIGRQKSLRPQDLVSTTHELRGAAWHLAPIAGRFNFILHQHDLEPFGSFQLTHFRFSPTFPLPLREQTVFYCTCSLEAK